VGSDAASCRCGCSSCSAWWSRPCGFVPLTLLQSERTQPTTSAGPTAGGQTGTGEPAGAPAVVGPASDPVSDPIRKADDVQA
jgi:hypothetical protein